MCQHNLTFFATGYERNGPYFDPSKGATFTSLKKSTQFVSAFTVIEKLELFDENSAEKKSNSKIKCNHPVPNRVNLFLS
jgi:hypothetical protein